MPRNTSKRENEPDLLTRKEAASYMGVAEQTLAVWKSTGRYNLPVVKVGRLVRYRRRDLDRFLESRLEPVQLLSPASITQTAQVVARNASVTHVTGSPNTAAPQLEIVLPNGVTLRLDAGCPLHLLQSIVQTVQTLEKR